MTGMDRQITKGLRVKLTWKRTHILKFTLDVPITKISQYDEKQQ